ncbi:MAG: YbaK/EbsC family protein [Legionella sp.]|uniref:YbaK/EbsC family protein n=1 Tax=Legionella sp. TaxID=459 RepID=UPI00284DB3AE|nr:YbaK/EbsC family protein [Legionella sp.]
MQKITSLLSTNNLWYETFEHAPVKTSEQAALTRPGYTLRQGAKAMIVKAYRTKTETEFVMLVFPADQKFNSDKVRKELGIKNLRFATEQEVSDLTGGVKIGGVPPFGSLFNLKVYADPSLFENEKIVFNAGDRGFSVAMKSSDYQALINLQVIDLI